MRQGALEIGLPPAASGQRHRRQVGWCNMAAWRPPRRSPARPMTCRRSRLAPRRYRLPEDINGALELLRGPTARHGHVLACERRKNPYFNLVELDEGGSLHVSKPLARRGRGAAGRRAGLETPRPRPMCWTRAYLKGARPLFEGLVIPLYHAAGTLHRPSDTPLDFRIVDFLMTERLT